jgi:hypothetical protein
LVIIWKIQSAWLLDFTIFNVIDITIVKVGIAQRKNSVNKPPRRITLAKESRKCPSRSASNEDLLLLCNKINIAKRFKNAAEVANKKISVLLEF